MALTQVSTGGIKDGQVQTADLADGQVTVGKLHAEALDRTYTLGADGSNHYTFTGEGLTGAVNDPTLYLTRGKTYRFVNGNSAGAHPFRIQTTVNGSAGIEYNTGVTNNGGAGGSTIVFEVPHAAPDVLYYQCTSHGSMGGIFYITGGLADGTVTLAKLEHGTSSNNGKFLRANNGADPTFETVNTDLVSDTSPQLGGTLDGNGQTADFTGNTTSLGLPRGSTAQQPSAGSTEGHIRYDNDDNVVYYSDGSQWIKIAAAIPSLSSVTGTLFAGATTNLTLAGTNFLSSNLVVNFLQTSDSINANVTVTPTSDTAATVAVPAAVYNNVTAGNAVTIKVTNSDAMSSGTQNITASALPSGGTITTSGNFRIHSFTSNGSFVNTINNVSIQYLVIAGGGGGGSAGGGGGAGGYRTNVPGQTSGASSSTEAAVTFPAATYTITVGAGGAAVDDARGSQGGASSISGSGITDITTVGGGGGGSFVNSAQHGGGSGGSAGGQDATNGTQGSPTANQGTGGGSGTGGAAGNSVGGGGGGAGAAGGNGNGNAPTKQGGSGGTGLSNNITGSAVTRGGGGGGGGDNRTSSGGAVGPSVGGAATGGGGAGGGSGAAGDATDGTGGGGGGAAISAGGNHGILGGDGGDGIVIVRYDLSAI